MHAGELESSQKEDWSCKLGAVECTVEFAECVVALVVLCCRQVRWR
jgi:hypothetical protein